MKTTQRTRPQQHYLKTLLMTPQLDRHSETDPKPEMLSAIQAENRIRSDKINVRGIGHAHIIRKEDFLGKDN